jgi:hypothetical protein
MRRWREILRRTSNSSVGILFVISIAFAFVSSGEPVIHLIEGTALQPVLETIHWRNSIVFDLSVGTLCGILLWFLVSWLPEQRKRTLLRENLATHYNQFKEDTIAIFLSALGSSYDAELPGRLTDHKQFREYFGANRSSKWNEVLNGFEAQPRLVNDLLVELEILSSEINYVLNNVAITNAEVHAFFKHLSGLIYRLKEQDQFTGDDLKPVSRFLWSIFSRWNFSDGQLQDDVVENMIRRI